MSGLAYAAGWALLHLTWQAVGIEALLRGALAVSGRAAPARRYALAFGAVLVLLVLPVLTAALLLARPPAPAGPAPAFAAAPGGAGPVGAPAGVGAALPAVLPWLAAAWAAGAAAAAAGCLRGWAWTLRVRRRGRRLEDPALRESFRRALRRAGIRREVGFLESAEVDVPALLGVLRPCVVLPRGLLPRLGPAAVDELLAHELAHLRRRDPLANLAQLAAETLWFFHPSVHRVSAEARRARELCCDAEVVRRQGRPLDYARTLAAVEELRPRRRPLALASGDGELLERIRSLVAGPAAAPAGRVPGPAAAGAGGVLLAAATAAALAATPARPAGAPPAPMEIRAADPAGAFTLRVERGRAVGATVGGRPVPRGRLRQDADSVYFLTPGGGRDFAVALRADGIRWTPRRVPPPRH